MAILNVSVRIETADEAAAEAAYEQLKTALSGFDDINMQASVVNRKAGMKKVAGQLQASK